ncbi:anti-sigma factor [Sphingomonas humi]|uniref:Anti-sigma factor n=1 Tax=Sphingomonas humi TaxID=335630 RepID=A0ABP7RM66_9SPHN
MSDDLTLAAEYVLRLLEGEELLDARRRLAADPAFASEVAWWEARLGPLYEEFGEEAPSRELWSRIVRRLDQPGDNVVTLKRQLARWRAAAAGAAVAAAVLLGLQLRPDTPLPAPAPQERPAAPLLVASLVGKEAPEALTVAYRADTRELVITPARVEAPANRARQLWLIPAGGQPISLGLVASEGIQRRVIAVGIARRFADGGTIAVSDEPTGGSPTGQPTGAVLAAGNLGTV